MAIDISSFIASNQAPDPMVALEPALARPISTKSPSAAASDVSAKANAMSGVTALNLTELMARVQAEEQNKLDLQATEARLSLAASQQAQAKIQENQTALAALTSADEDMSELLAQHSLRDAELATEYDNAGIFGKIVTGFQRSYNKAEMLALAQARNNVAVQINDSYVKLNGAISREVVLAGEIQLKAAQAEAAERSAIINASGYKEKTQAMYQGMATILQQGNAVVGAEQVQANEARQNEESALRKQALRQQVADRDLIMGSMEVSTALRVFGRSDTPQNRASMLGILKTMSPEAIQQWAAFSTVANSAQFIGSDAKTLAAQAAGFSPSLGNFVRMASGDVKAVQTYAMADQAALSAARATLRAEYEKNPANFTGKTGRAGGLTKAALEEIEAKAQAQVAATSEVARLETLAKDFATKSSAPYNPQVWTRDSVAAAVTAAKARGSTNPVLDSLPIQTRVIDLLARPAVRRDEVHQTALAVEALVAKGASEKQAVNAVATINAVMAQNSARKANASLTGIFDRQGINFTPAVIVNVDKPSVLGLVRRSVGNNSLGATAIGGAAGAMLIPNAYNQASDTFGAITADATRESGVQALYIQLKKIRAYEGDK